MSETTDPTLYRCIKESVYKTMPVHSAYRSGHVVQQYKKAFALKHGKKINPYRTLKRSLPPLKRWFREKWKTQSGNTAYRRPGDIFRPTRRISRLTPTTLNELSESQLKRARKEKRLTGRVKKF